MWDKRYIKLFLRQNAVLARGPRSSYSISDVVLPLQLRVGMHEKWQDIRRLSPDCAETMTSITLNWLLDYGLDYDEVGAILSDVPNLRALQFRSILKGDGEGGARPSMRSYLASHPWLTVLSRNTKIQCLAWPMESFLPYQSPPIVLPERTRQAIVLLGLTLKSLRIDADMLYAGESITGEKNGASNKSFDRGGCFSITWRQR